jgi:hypothetical protein
MDALLVDINQAGLGRGLQFELFRPGADSVREFYAELPISVKVVGTYHDMGAFASDIGQLSRIVTLNDVSITTQKDGNLTMDATARTFRYLDDDEANAQRKAAAPKASRRLRNEAPSRTALIVAAGALSAAAAATSTSELRQELAEATKDFRGQVPPLPQVKAYEPVPYTAESMTIHFARSA